MIYLDNSATTRTDQEVISVMNDVMNRVFANPSSLHKLGGEAERLVDLSRQTLARLMSVSPKEVLFTSGGTEANNLAIQGVAMKYEQRGRHIITTQIEHPSVYDVCQKLEKLGWKITYLPVDPLGRVNPLELKKAITKETVLVSIMHVNNETGTVQPIEEMGQILRSHSKIIFHVDAVQSFTKFPLRPKQMHIDLLSISAHKFHGPKGVGALFIREGIQLAPLFAGGGQERGFRSGTLNVPGIAGMTKAAVLADMKRERHVLQLQKWKETFIQQVTSQLDPVKVNGDISKEGGSPFIISLSFPGLKSEVIVHSLESKDCYVSSKSACSSKLEKPSRVLLAMGLTPEEALGTIRISMGYDSKENELVKLQELLIQSISQLQKWVKV